MFTSSFTTLLNKNRVHSNTYVKSFYGTLGKAKAVDQDDASMKISAHGVAGFSVWMVSVLSFVESR